MSNIIASASVPPANRLIDADTTNLTAIQRPADIRFPMNAPYGSATDADDLALIQAAIRANPAAVRELADAIRHGDGRYAEGYADGLSRAFAALRPAGCPPWCSNDHRGQITEEDGFTIGLGHERIVTELTAKDPAWTDKPATATVMVESTTEGSEVTTPTRVVVSIAEGTEGHYPGSEDVQGWTGTPEQAEQFAAALMAAAAITRGTR